MYLEHGTTGSRGVTSSRTTRRAGRARGSDAMGSFLEGVDQQTEVFAFVFIVLAAYMYIKCDSPSSPPPLLSARACSALRRLDCEAPPAASQ